MPPLLVAAWEAGTLTEAQTDKMEDAELVYLLDADAAERAGIEDVWRGHIRLVGTMRARSLFGVPRWFARAEAVREVAA